MKKAKMLVAFLLALLLVVPMMLTACNKPNNPDNGGNDGGNGGNTGGGGNTGDQVEAVHVDTIDKITNTTLTVTAPPAGREADWSLYEAFGSQVKINMVYEDTLTGFAYIMVNNVKYELGMDFLSMAMVYNTTPVGDFKTEDNVYNEWWRLYIQRWNYMVPEVPLYSNAYIDLYNAKISNFQTAAFWTPYDDIVGANSSDGKVTFADVTELTGLFRDSAFGKTSPVSSDLNVQNLTTGYSTMYTDESGTYKWADDSIIKSHTETTNQDGSVTYRIEIANNLKFSDGSAITAKNYLYSLIASRTAVVVAAGGIQQGKTETYVGEKKFASYTSSGSDKVFSGVRLYNDYEFSVTIDKEYANWYYRMTYGAFSPVHKKLYFPEGYDIKDDGNGCYITGDYFAKSADKYTLADTIKANINNTDANSIPYSGPYIVSKWDSAAQTVTLAKNSNYTGDHRGQGNINTIVIIKGISDTQMDMFTSGQIDILAGVSGKTESEAAIKLVNDNPTKYKYCQYDRAGYGKLGLVSDFGPTSFVEVRQSIMYIINRDSFMKAYAGDYGFLVHGPYYSDLVAYKANEDMILNAYNFSTDDAKALLEKGGWVYNAEGGAYTSGVRYKKLTAEEATEANINFATRDGKYKTVKVGSDYYMPLAINWTGTTNNPITELLQTQWKNAKSTEEIGMYVHLTLSATMESAIYGDYYRMPAYGFSGDPRCGAVNWATGFNSTIYDYAHAWTIDESMYLDYNMCMMKDSADYYSSYTK